MLFRSGCTAPGLVRTRIVGRNMRRVAFYRDGRLVKTVRLTDGRIRTATLRTRIALTDFTMHTVVVKVRFAKGSTPARKILLHRFAQCRSAVTG